MTALFFTAWLVGFSGAIMPGPMLTAVISYSARKSWTDSLWIVVGHGVAEVAVVVLLVTGAGQFLSRPAATTFIAVVGGLVLLWMGYDMVKGALQGQIQLHLTPAGGEAAAVEAARELSPQMAGFLTSLSNPYWSLWWATIGLTLMTQSMQKGTPGLLAFYTGHILADFSWYLLVGLMVHWGRNFLGPKVYRGIITVCGVFLVALALRYLFYGFRGILV